MGKLNFFFIVIEDFEFLLLQSYTDGFDIKTVVNIEIWKWAFKVKNSESILDKYCCVKWTLYGSYPILLKKINIERENS